MRDMAGARVHRSNRRVRLESQVGPGEEGLECEAEGLFSRPKKKVREGLTRKVGG